MSASTWTAEQLRALGVRTDLVTAASVLGIGRTTAHELARRDAFPVPVLRLGRRYVVPVAPVLRLLGLDYDQEGAPDGQRATRHRQDG
ncbi:MAG: hypothetical protein ACR2KL_07260 [Nocardioidaceae bacterium]